MSDQDANESNILLRVSDITGWKAEWESMDDAIQEAEARVKQLRRRRSELSTLLTGAVAFAPDLKNWLEEQEQKRLEREARDAPEDLALTDAILKILKKQGKATRDVIRGHLPGAGYAIQKIQANPNYLYTAIARLIARDKIEETAPGTGVFKLKG
jgi:hypothetical protein